MKKETYIWMVNFSEGPMFPVAFKSTDHKTARKNMNKFIESFPVGVAAYPVTGNIRTPGDVKRYFKENEKEMLKAWNKK